MKRFSRTIKKGSIHHMAISLLNKSQKPMNVKEITKLVLEKKQLETKTPYNTVNAILQRSDQVVKVGKATYALK